MEAGLVGLLEDVMPLMRAVSLFGRRVSSKKMLPIILVSALYGYIITCNPTTYTDTDNNDYILAGALALPLYQT